MEEVHQTEEKPTPSVSFRIEFMHPNPQSLPLVKAKIKAKVTVTIQECIVWRRPYTKL